MGGAQSPCCAPAGTRPRQADPRARHLQQHHHHHLLSTSFSTSPCSNSRAVYSSIKLPSFIPPVAPLSPAAAAAAALCTQRRPVCSTQCGSWLVAAAQQVCCTRAWHVRPELCAHSGQGSKCSEGVWQDSAELQAGSTKSKLRGRGGWFIRVWLHQQEVWGWHDCKPRTR